MPKIVDTKTIVILLGVIFVMMGVLTFLGFKKYKEFDTKLNMLSMAFSPPTCLMEAVRPEKKVSFSEEETEILPQEHREETPEVVVEEEEKLKTIPEEEEIDNFEEEIDIEDIENIVVEDVDEEIFLQEFAKEEEE
jgi:hypothetical protein